MDEVCAWPPGEDPMGGGRGEPSAGTREREKPQRCVREVAVEWWARKGGALWRPKEWKSRIWWGRVGGKAAAEAQEVPESGTVPRPSLSSPQLAHHFYSFSSIFRRLDFVNFFFHFLSASMYVVAVYRRRSSLNDASAIRSACFLTFYHRLSR